MRYITVTPAYGRDYKAKAEVLKAWDEGADFRVQDPFLSGYMNKDDKPAGSQVSIRFARLTKICVIR